MNQKQGIGYFTQKQCPRLGQKAQLIFYKQHHDQRVGEQGPVVLGLGNKLNGPVCLIGQGGLYDECQNK